VSSPTVTPTLQRLSWHATGRRGRRITLAGEAEEKRPNRSGLCRARVVQNRGSDRGPSCSAATCRRGLTERSKANSRRHQAVMSNRVAPPVKGKWIDEYTRCVHYHSVLDVIAIKFKCCGEYYPCYDCHQEAVSHAHAVWEKHEFTTAILCGICKHEMTIHEYAACHHRCPFCQVPFNPNCDTHSHLYFAV
jgi:uncharacterized CHY-type Zn-finger protein